MARLLEQQETLQITGRQREVLILIDDVILGSKAEDRPHVHAGEAFSSERLYVCRVVHQLAQKGSPFP